MEVFDLHPPSETLAAAAGGVLPSSLLLSGVGVAGRGLTVLVLLSPSPFLRAWVV